MPSKYESEKLVGILLRTIVGEIVRAFRNKTLNKLYKGNDQKLSEISRNCMFWNSEIAKYFSDNDPVYKKKKELYSYLLILYEDEGIDPDKDDLWRLLMKKDLPTVFYRRFEPLGHVPQVASLDDSELPESKKDSKDITEVNW